MSTNYDSIKNIILALGAKPGLTADQVHRVIVKNVGADGKLYTKAEILKHYNFLRKSESILDSPAEEENFRSNIKMKQIRTLSGVTPVTVLTKPFPCPGKCIFCPNDVKMPKSYISSEPGAQRAFTHRFDPYMQTAYRLKALKSIGHNIDKIELIILGGTWTSYPKDYRVWFVKRCFDAMNDFGTKDLLLKDPVKLTAGSEVFLVEHENAAPVDYNKHVVHNIKMSAKPSSVEEATWAELEFAHNINTKAKSRCVGLVIETRPDEITEETVNEIRRLGATKVQLGVQSLNDDVLAKNKRGHDSAQTARAFKLLRSAGFKIHAHLMPNLYGATPDSDIEDFKILFTDPRFKPDELKIYPCSLIGGTELMSVYKNGRWKPYSHAQLLHVIAEGYKFIPRYCRVTRVIRDIPSQHILAGNKKTNFRQDLEHFLKSTKKKINEIRAREIHSNKVNAADLIYKSTRYDTTGSTEYFLEFITASDEIVAFLRLSLPVGNNSNYTKATHFISELTGKAIIREVHVYGESLNIGARVKSKSQHLGLGNKLVIEARKLAEKEGFSEIAVISAVGTRAYYHKLGFKSHGMYQERTTP